jgi:hypothetical protein
VVYESWSPANKLILELRMFTMYQYRFDSAVRQDGVDSCKGTARLLVGLPCRCKDQGYTYFDKLVVVIQ